MARWRPCHRLFAVGVFMTVFAWDLARPVAAEVDAEPSCPAGEPHCDVEEEALLQTKALHSKEAIVPANPTHTKAPLLHSRALHKEAPLVQTRVRHSKGGTRKRGDGDGDGDDYVDDAPAFAIHWGLNGKVPNLTRDTPACEAIGARAWVSQKALDYFGTSLLPAILPYVGDFPIADEKGHSSGFTYHLTNLKLSNVKLTAPTLQFDSANQGLKLVVDISSGTLTGAYDIEGQDWWNPLGSSGLMTFNVYEGTRISGILVPGLNSTGHVSLHLASMDINLVANLDVSDYLVNLVVSALETIATEMLYGEVARELKHQTNKAIRDMNKELAGMSFIADLLMDPPYDFASLDFTLCGITFGDDHVAVDLRGAFLDRKPLPGGLPKQGQPTALPAAPPAGYNAHMITVAVTDWSINGGLALFQAHGAMDSNSSFFEAPSDARTSMPNWLLSQGPNFDVGAKVNGAPTVEFMTDGEVQVAMDTQVGFVCTNCRIVPLSFQAEAVFKTAMSFKVTSGNPQTLYPRLKYTSLNGLKIQKDSSGMLSATCVAQLLNAFDSMVTVPAVNAILSTGFPLSGSNFMQLEATNVAASVTDGALLVSTDIEWDVGGFLGEVFGPNASQYMDLANIMMMG